MVAAFDTNIVVDYLRGFQSTIVKVESYDHIYLPSIVCGELLFGAAISANPNKHEEKVREFIRKSRVLACDSIVASEYAIIRQHLKRKGKPIPENDLWIAATAHANGLPLITRDLHFAHIDLLDVEFWK